MKLSKIKSNRTFGVEIEFINTSGFTKAQLADELTDLGFNVISEAYNHNTRDNWKIVTDGSTDLELVSPVLRGQAGLDETMKLAKALSDLGCSVNRTCGVHVHVGIANDTNRNKGIINLLKYMHANRRIIDSLMPDSRRENNNRYCKETMNFLWTGAQVNRKLNKIFNQNYHYTESLITSIQNWIGDSRYKKLNLNSFRKYGTVEFRQHSGSLDSQKIGNWIVFCTSTVDKCFKAKQMSAVINQPHIAESIINCFAVGYNRKMFNYVCDRLKHFNVLPINIIEQAHRKAIELRRV